MEHHQHLDEVAAETLEGLLFCEVSSATADAFTEQTPCHWSQIELIEPNIGRLTLLSSEALVHSLCDFLLEEEAPSSEQIKSCLEEVLNTLAGGFLYKASEASEQFDLGLPLYERGAYSQFCTQQPTDVRFYNSDAGAFALVLDVEQ